jgi:Predicted transcriptional regulators
VDIDVFIARRKELKLSQVKLCAGICTQATLSKFENNNRVPSLAILNQLCARLGITVDNLYQSRRTARPSWPARWTWSRIS